MRAWVLLFDVAAVVLFVTIGRDTHDEGLAFGGIIGTAAPFLIALMAGWAATRAWRRPASLPTGVGTLAVTLAGGMLLRGTVFDEGTAGAFIVVTAGFLAPTMMGWRVVAFLVLRGRPAARVFVGRR